MTIITQLRSEWTILVETPIDWPEPPFNGAYNAGAVLARVSVEPDLLLGALLHKVDQDQLAGRIIVQALLPKLCSMALADPCARIDDYVAALWLTIKNYPHHRRHKVAANLALDTRKVVFADRAKLIEAPELRPSSEPHARDIIALAGELGIVSPHTCDLLQEIYLDATPRADVARRHRMSEAALRQTCSRAVRRLATHRSDLLAA
ncbi:MAG: hypothetical protein ACRCWS_03845 [Propionibacteriaceae bacterium]